MRCVHDLGKNKWRAQEIESQVTIYTETKPSEKHV